MDANELQLAELGACEVSVASILRRESWASRRRRLRRRLRHAEWRRGQYRLKTLFQIVTAASVLSWACFVLLPSCIEYWVYDQMHERLALSEVGKLGGGYQRFLCGFKIDLSVNGVAQCVQNRSRMPDPFPPLIPVSDNSLSCVLHVPNVAILDLRGQPISDAGLAQIVRLRDLRILDLRRTAVTDAGVADFQRSLPDCKIVR